MVKLRARCLLVGDAAVGKSALSHMFYSDGTLFQKNYSMEWHPVWSLAAIAQLVVGDKRMQVYLASILGNDSHPMHGTVAALGSSFSERLLYLKYTTGVEVLIKCVNIPATNDSVELYIIDSAGKETLVESCEKLWGEPSLLCLVFDLTSEQSFANCSRWMERVHAHCQGLHVPGVLVGNKLDLSARREVQASMAEEWAQSQGLEYHETSAKEMENCNAPLLSLARAFHSLYQERRETIQNLNPS